MSKSQLIDSNLNLSDTYSQMSRFIDIFQTNIFIDEEFYALQASLTFLKLLLQFHSPDLSLFLDQAGVTPELYAIPWFVTYLSTKIVKVELTLEFWELVVRKNDPTFIFYFLTSFILRNTKKIKNPDVAKLPETMTSLRILNQKELELIW
jgi:hypothetical protein